MTLIELSPTERQCLRQIVKRARDAKQVKRAQALLWLDQGEPVAHIAVRQGVSHQTIYNWRTTYMQRRQEPVDERLRDRARSGRPPHKRQAVQALIREVMDQDPRQWGYRAVVWTAPLLRRHLQREQDVEVSIRTVRRALRDLQYRCKRPRYVLARRSPTWRQAKGGSNVG